MFGIKTRRENREQFRLLEMEMEIVLKRLRELESGESECSVLTSDLGGSKYLTKELLDYTDLREKYRPHTKEFNM